MIARTQRRLAGDPFAPVGWYLIGKNTVAAHLAYGRSRKLTRLMHKIAEFAHSGLFTRKQ